MAQVSSATITAYDATTTYSVTINGKSVSVQGTGGSTGSTATALQAALAASTIKEFTEVTWSVVSSSISGTAATAGVPFTVTSGVSGGVGTFGAFSTTTASAGPNDWSTAANWSTGSVPVGADDVYIENTSSSILYGLDQHTVTLTSLHVRATFTGTIGLPNVNSGGYYEYRPTYLQVSATTLNVGQGPGAGSGRVKIDVGTAQTTVNVFNTGTTSETNVESFLFKGTHASNVVTVNKGSVAIAPFASDTAVVATLVVGYQTNQASDATVRAGTGTTLTTVDVYGGTLTAFSNITTVNQYGGTFILYTGTWTTLNCWGGKAYCRSTGTFATNNVGNKGTLDCSADGRTKTFTNVTMYAGASLLDPNHTVTFSNAITLSGCGLEDVTLLLGKNYTLTPASY